MALRTTGPYEEFIAAGDNSFNLRHVVRVERRGEDTYHLSLSNGEGIAVVRSELPESSQKRLDQLFGIKKAPPPSKPDDYPTLRK
jgi:hypothetical protein